MLHVPVSWQITISIGIIWWNHWVIVDNWCCILHGLYICTVILKPYISPSWICTPHTSYNPVLRTDEMGQHSPIGGRQLTWRRSTIKCECMWRSKWLLSILGEGADWRLIWERINSQHVKCWSSRCWLLICPPRSTINTVLTVDRRFDKNIVKIHVWLMLRCHGQLRLIRIHENVDVCQSLCYTAHKDHIVNCHTGYFPKNRLTLLGSYCKYIAKWLHFTPYIRISVSFDVAGSTVLFKYITWLPEKLVLITLADPGGTAGAHPLSFPILSFWHYFFMKRGCNGSQRPLWGWRPLWEIMDPPMNQSEQWRIQDFL